MYCMLYNIVIMKTVFFFSLWIKSVRTVPVLWPANIMSVICCSKEMTITNSNRRPWRKCNHEKQVWLKGHTKGKHQGNRQLQEMYVCACTSILTRANSLLRTICSSSEDLLWKRWGCMWLHIWGNHQNSSTYFNSKSSPSSSSTVPAHTNTHTHTQGQRDKEWHMYKCMLHGDSEHVKNFCCTQLHTVISLKHIIKHLGCLKLILLDKVQIWYHGDEIWCHSNNRCYGNMLYSISDFI